MKHLFHIIYLILAPLLLGCVTEDDVFDDDFSMENDVTETSLIVSFLNEKYSNNNSTIPNCAAFIYPIDIAYNTNQTITVINENGLLEVIQSQSSNFHISSIVYPINVLINNIETTIENNNDFNSIFQACDIKTLNSTLVENITNCINFQYPIILLNDLQNKVSITTNNDFITFIENESINYTANFEFPFTINETIINNYFDIYQITNACIEISCPKISFTTVALNNNYTFEASGYSGDGLYTWSINNDIVENEFLSGVNNEFLSFDFTENDTFTVCLFIETPECPEGVTFCQDIIVASADPCPVISFQTIAPTTILDSIYTFTASSDIDINSNYSWFINGEFTNNDTTSENSNQFVFEFPENGTYEVSVFIETPDCPLGASFSETIEVTTVGPL